MPPRPTCKVVKKPNETGARIYPRGCKVRRVQQADGSIKKYNKQGQEKAKIRYAIGDPMGRNIAYVWLAIDYPNAGNVEHTRGVHMIWDTGATITLMKYADAEAWGLIRKPNGRLRAFSDAHSQNAHGEVSRVRIYKNVPFTIKWGNVEETVRDDIMVHSPPVVGSNLLGTKTMRKLKRLKMKPT